jgi:hypothetical protein
MLCQEKSGNPALSNIFETKTLNGMSSQMRKLELYTKQNRFPLFLRNFCGALEVKNRVARFFLVHDTKTGKMYQIDSKRTQWS